LNTEVITTYKCALATYERAVIAACHGGRMSLAEEAQRYLAVVEAFRASGCEPRWRAETSGDLARRPASTAAQNPAVHPIERK